jgi:hypothetical protein
MMPHPDDATSRAARDRAETRRGMAALTPHGRAAA